MPSMLTTGHTTGHIVTDDLSHDDTLDALQSIGDDRHDHVVMRASRGPKEARGKRSSSLTTLLSQAHPYAAQAQSKADLSSTDTDYAPHSPLGDDVTPKFAVPVSSEFLIFCSFMKMNSWHA
jgi:hypothetical protein